MARSYPTGSRGADRVRADFAGANERGLRRSGRGFADEEGNTYSEDRAGGMLSRNEMAVALDVAKFDDPVEVLPNKGGTVVTGEKHPNPLAGGIIANREGKLPPIAEQYSGYYNSAMRAARELTMNALLSPTADPQEGVIIRNAIKSIFILKSQGAIGDGVSLKAYANIWEPNSKPYADFRVPLAELKNVSGVYIRVGKNVISTPLSMSQNNRVMSVISKALKASGLQGVKVSGSVPPARRRVISTEE